MASVLNNYFAPEREIMDDILLLLAEIGVAYTAEIQRRLECEYTSVNKTISKLKNMGFIDRFVPDRNSPQTPIKVRIGALNAQGITGYESIMDKNWWILTLAGFEYIRAKYKGQKKQIRGALLKYLNLEYEEPDNMSDESQELLAGMSKPSS